MLRHIKATTLYKANVWIQNMTIKKEGDCQMSIVADAHQCLLKCSRTPNSIVVAST